MLGWKEARLGTFTLCTVTVGDYMLSVMGADDGTGWMWLIKQQDLTLFHGLEKSLAGAKQTTETVVQRMQDRSAGGA